jgi:hypothetical protein
MTLHEASRNPEADTEDVSTMSIERDPHPRREQLAAFDAGQLAPAEREAIERHLAACPLCGRELDTLPEHPFVALVRASAEAHPASTLDTPMPASLGVPDALARHPRYRILGVLGEGGMGLVYKAVHRVLDRVVALKVLHRRFTDHPDFIERFRQEARALARLSHPHIALAYDAEHAGDLHFLVMEYVPGMSLDRVAAQRGPLPVAEACDYVRQAALGLQHAFEHGLIHRDVKPQNLMRTPAGQIKVLDFGLVHLARESGEEATPPSATFAGTPDYSAPEQARDPDNADIRADVYALGGTFHFLLTGQPPFLGGSALQKMLAHQDRPPRPVSEFRADVPDPLLALLERMLAKDRAERPATPVEVARALAAFAGVAEEPSASRTAAPPLRRRWLWLSAAVALVAAAGVGLMLTWPHPSLPPPTSNPAPASAEPLELATAEQLAARKRERREQILTWLRQNTAVKLRDRIIQQAARAIDQDFDRLDGIQLLLGRRLTLSGQATLLAANPGCFFVSSLTAEQARALDLKEIGSQTLICRAPPRLRRAVPRVRLSQLRIDPAGELAPDRKITGSVAYEVYGPALSPPFAVRFTFYSDKGRRCSGLAWFKDRDLSGDGTLAFAHPLPGGLENQPAGPFVLFADVVVTRGQRGDYVVESVAVAVLVEVIPPQKPLAP